MIQRTETLVDEIAGAPIAGAKIHVYNPDGTVASLTSDGTTPLVQPVLSNAFGIYSYFAATGYYNEDIFLGGRRLWKQANVAVGVPAVPLGFPTGSGGAITQTVDRNTGVVLNTPAGQITLVSATSGAAGSKNIFVLTNSQITDKDLVIANMNSGALNNYRVDVLKVGNGFAAFCVETITNNGQTDSPKINFGVFKGANS